MPKGIYMGSVAAGDTWHGPAEVMLVDAGRVRSVRQRAAKLRENILTYFFGTLIKQVLEDLDLRWELNQRKGRDKEVV